MSAELTQDAFLKQFLERIPYEVQQTFSPQQQRAIERAVTQQWTRHPVDIRFAFGFWRWRYFCVLLAGRDQRRLTRRQQRFFTLAEFSFLLAYGITSTLFGILVLYLLKSWMGIDVFPNFSFGVWDWFNQHLFSWA